MFDIIPIYTNLSDQLPNEKATHMTHEKIHLNETHLKYAGFHSADREHLQTLSNKANEILVLMLHRQETDAEYELYKAIKWAIKRLDAVEKDNLERCTPIKKVKSQL